jgi:hypothetical protein
MLNAGENLEATHTCRDASWIDVMMINEGQIERIQAWFCDCTLLFNGYALLF